MSRDIEADYKEDYENEERRCPPWLNNTKIV